VTSAGGPRTLAGRYRLDEVIGRGGMSTVYRGTDQALDRVVAVKVALDPLVEQSPIYLARFTREAHAAAAIGHPGVVTVYDAGADGPTRFIVMELVPGRSLADVLRDERPLDPDRAASIAAQVVDALSAAHAAGIIHRDIKPGNIMVTPDGSVKVLDFGIARALDSATLTQTATVLGTSAYMSPEQALGQPVDARSDIYSLGCVLYEMLTGEPPFTADVSAAVLHQHVRVEPTPARERNPAIPPALGDLVMQMLAKSPSDRPQTAAEVRDRLGRIPDEVQSPEEAAPTAAARLAPRPPSRTPPGNRAPATVPPPPPPERSTKGFWITVFVVAAVLLGGAVAVAVTGGGSAGTSSTTTGHSSPALTSSHTTTSQPLAHPSTTSATAPTRTTTSTSGSTSTSTTPTTSSSTTSTTSPTTSTTSPTTSTTSPTAGTSSSATSTTAP
jgi:eukaryotic-like serine/threonine-protein kinase